MRTALTRTAVSLAFSLCALASCSYSAIEGALNINVVGMPESATSAQVVITESADPGSPIMRNPHFGTGVYTSQPLLLTLPPLQAGAFTVQVTAYDVDSTPLAVGNGSGVFVVSTSDAGPLPEVQVALSASGLDGTYGSPCIATGTGTNGCSGGLACKSYSSTDIGICTHSCNANTACDAVPPNSSCEAFASVAADTFCQWECGTTDAGDDCPPTLVCGPVQSSSGGKRFCQGSL